MIFFFKYAWTDRLIHIGIMIDMSWGKIGHLIEFLFSWSLSISHSTGLSICGHNCLLTAEWISASKIVCRVGPAKDDKGEIIVTTKSGGQGTSTVSFKLLKPERIGETHTHSAFKLTYTHSGSVFILPILHQLCLISWHFVRSRKHLKLCPLTAGKVCLIKKRLHLVLSQ